MTVVGIVPQIGASDAASAKLAGIKLRVTHLALGAAGWNPDSSSTDLRAEYMRQEIFNYELIGDATKRISTVFEPVRQQLRSFTGDDLWLYPANANAKIANVAVTDTGGDPYTLNTDYTIDSVRGEIERIEGGAIVAGTTVLIGYEEYGEPIAVTPYTFTADIISLPISIARATSLVVYDADGDRLTLGSDYAVDDRLAKVSRVDGGAISSGGDVLVSYQHDAPVREIAIYSESGNLFAIASSSSLPALTYLSALDRGQILSFNLQVIGLPAETVEVVVNAPDTLVINPIESALIGIWNWTIDHAAWRIRHSANIKKLERNHGLVNYQ